MTDTESFLRWKSEGGRQANKNWKFPEKTQKHLILCQEFLEFQLTLYPDKLGKCHHSCPWNTFPLLLTVLLHLWRRRHRKVSGQNRWHNIWIDLAFFFFAFSVVELMRPCLCLHVILYAEPVWASLCAVGRKKKKKVLSTIHMSPQRSSPLSFSLHPVSLCSFGQRGGESCSESWTETDGSS